MDGPGFKSRFYNSFLFSKIVQTFCRAHHTSNKISTEVLSQEDSCRGVILITQFHLKSRLSMCWTLPVIPTYDFMVWTGTILPLPLKIYFKISTKFYGKLSSVFRAITCVRRIGLKGQFGKPFSSSWNEPKNSVYLGPGICAVLGYCAA